MNSKALKSILLNLLDANKRKPTKAQRGHFSWILLKVWQLRVIITFLHISSMKSNYTQVELM